MSRSIPSDILEILSAAAVPAALALLAGHLIRYVVILNRRIGNDVNATHRRMGHHRYIDPGDAAHDGVNDRAHDGLHVEPGQSGIDWLCRRARERRDRAGRGVPGERSEMDGGSAVAAVAGVAIAGDVAHPDGRPPGPRAGRAARPVVFVRGGAFAGARVRVLMESRELAGLWFVEVLDGKGRGDITAVDGMWITDR